MYTIPINTLPMSPIYLLIHIQISDLVAQDLSDNYSEQYLILDSLHFRSS